MSDTERLQVGRSVDGLLRDRIADAIRRAGYEHSYAPGPYLAGLYADAVIDALDLGIPCASDGCRMRQIARRGAEKLGLTGDGA